MKKNYPNFEIKANAGSHLGYNFLSIGNFDPLTWDQRIYVDKFPFDFKIRLTKSTVNPGYDQWYFSQYIWSWKGPWYGDRGGGINEWCKWKKPDGSIDGLKHGALYIALAQG